MNYDETAMPSNYDRGRSYPPGVLEKWLDVISRHVLPGTASAILDVGCGTGRYSGALASHFGCDVVGIDPSEKMLAEARSKAAAGRVRYERASAESLPLRDGSVDLVFMSMVYHHLDDSARALRECRRVLRPNGKLCLRAGTTDLIETYPYVRFFPSSRRLLSERLHSTDRIVASFQDAGFRLRAHELVDSVTAQNWREYAQKLAYRADSILTQLSDDEFSRGMEQLNEHAEKADATVPVIETVDFFAFEPVRV